MNLSKQSLRKRASSFQQTSKLEAGRGRSRTGSSVTPINETTPDGKRSPSPPITEKSGTGGGGVVLSAVWKRRIKWLLAVAVLLLLLFQVVRWNLTRKPCIVMETAEMEMQTSMPRKNFIPEMPKIIHHQWKTSVVPEKFQMWYNSWKTYFPEPEYRYILWTDTSGRELIKEHYPFFLRTYDEYPFGIQRADSMRYFILHHYGGIYADLDYEPKANFWSYIPKDRAGLVESPYQYAEIVQNSFMTSPRNDPFWLSVFDALERFKDKPVFQSTGPSLLAYAFAQNVEPYYKLPCENFYRIPHGEYDRSPFWGVLQRETIGRFYPMKYCGEFADPKCQLGQHHCAASYIKDTGVLALIWNGK